MSVETTGIEPEVPVSAVLSLVTVTLGALIGLAGLAWAADLYRMLGWNFLTEQFLAAVLALGLAMVFVTRSARRGSVPRAELPWYDAALALISLGSGLYMAWAYPTILADFFNTPIDGLVVSWLLFVLVIEALRRTSGWSLVIVVLAFTLYALVGHWEAISRRARSNSTA